MLLHLTVWHGFFNNPKVIHGALKAYFPPEIIAKNHERLNTEKYMNKNLPPIFIMTANHDMPFPHDSTIRLDGYLMVKGINHKLHIYGDEEHPCGHVFHIDQSLLNVIKMR